MLGKELKLLFWQSLRSDACYFCGNYCWVGCTSPVFIRIFIGGRPGLPMGSTVYHYPLGPLVSPGLHDLSLQSMSPVSDSPHRSQRHLLNKQTRKHYSLDSTLQRLPTMQTPSYDAHGLASAQLNWLPFCSQLWALSLLFPWPGRFVFFHMSFLWELSSTTPSSKRPPLTTQLQWTFMSLQ